MSRVLITGCSTGIGRASAVELTKRGHEVVATARRPETLEDLDVVARLPLDVDDAASVRAAVDAAGPLDGLVNNAGFGVGGPAETVDLDAARRCMETNLFGAARMIQAVLPGLRARGGGTIVNVASVAGRVGVPLEGFYSASKWALEGLSEALHFEVGHFGIRVRIVEPGAFETRFSDNLVGRGIDGALRRARHRVDRGPEPSERRRRGQPRSRAGRRGDRRRAREQPRRGCAGRSATTPTW